MVVGTIAIETGALVTIKFVLDTANKSNINTLFLLYLYRNSFKNVCSYLFWSTAHSTYVDHLQTIDPVTQQYYQHWRSPIQDRFL